MLQEPKAYLTVPFRNCSYTNLNSDDLAFSNLPSIWEFQGDTERKEIEITYMYMLCMHIYRMKEELGLNKSQTDRVFQKHADHAGR